MTGAAVELRDAGLAADGRVRLHPTSLCLEPGTVTAVVGRNGSGKSTLLALMASELEPSSGRVLLHGDDLAGLSLVERARRRAMLTQETHVSFGFSVAEIVRWGRTPWRGTESAADDDRVVADAIESQGLAGLEARPVTSLSGGERKRVHIARVLAQRAPLLLLDEADSDLDLVGRRVVDDLVRQHAAGGGTAVVVSHDVSRLSRISDRVIALREGLVHADGAVAEVVTEPVLSGAFGARVVVTGSGADLAVHLP